MHWDILFQLANIWMLSQHMLKQAFVALGSLFQEHKVLVIYIVIFSDSGENSVLQKCQLKGKNELKLIEFKMLIF